jgi:O-antigen/teichoic acid export membrane protein
MPDDEIVHERARGEGEVLDGDHARSLSEFLRHAVVYGIGSLGSGAAHLVLLPLYAHLLGAEEYGEFTIAQTFFSFVLLFSILGLDSAVIRYYYKYVNDEDRRGVVSTALWVLSLTAFVVLVAGILVRIPLSRLVFGSPAGSRLIAIVFVGVGVSAVLRVPLIYLRATARSKEYVALNLARLAGIVIATFLLVAVLRRGIEGALWAMVLGPGLVLAFALPMLWRRVGASLRTREIGPMLRFGLPFVPAGLALWVLTLVDRYYLERLVDFREVGLYSLGYQIGMAIVLVLMAFQLAWPQYAFSVAGRADAPRLYASVLRLYAFILVSIAFLISLFSRQIVALIAPPEFLSAAAVVPIILASYVCYGGYLIFSVGIMLAERTSLNMAVAGGAALLNLVLNALFIPRYGMMGAAWTTLASYAVLAAGMYAISQRYYPIPYAPGRALGILGLAAVLFHLGQRMLPHEGFAHAAGGLGLIAVYGVGLWISRLVSRSEIAVLAEWWRGITAFGGGSPRPQH